VLVSDSIEFEFWGYTEESLKLAYLEIYSKKYQSPNIKIIGMSFEDVKSLIGQSTKFHLEGENIRILDDDRAIGWAYTLRVDTKDGFVTGYMIARAP
jgi:hypothetical protein